MDYMQAYCYYKQSLKYNWTRPILRKLSRLCRPLSITTRPPDKVPEANLVIELSRRKLEKKEYKQR